MANLNGNQYDPTRNEPIESCDTEYGRQNEELRRISSKENNGEQEAQIVKFF